MSIPISADKTLVWEDPKTSVKYHFRYLIGDRLEAYVDGSRAFTANPSAFLEKAVQDVKKTHKDKRFKKGELESLSMARATALASEEGVSNVKPLVYARFLADIFLAKWEGDVKLPKLPERPSSLLQQDLLVALSEQIGNNINALVGLSGDEAKN